MRWSTIFFLNWICICRCKNRVQDVDSLINLYRNNHGYSVVLKAYENKSFCQLKFVLSGASCRSIGNNYGRFLDDLSWAILLSRTIVASWDMSECYDGLVFLSWITPQDSFLEFAKSSRCSNFDKVLYRGLKGKDIPLKCCNGESVNTSVLYFGSFTNEAFNMFHPASGALLSPAARSNADTMYYNDYGLGKYQSFGILQDHTIMFTNHVTNITKSILTSIMMDSGVTTSVHSKGLWRHLSDGSALTTNLQAHSKYLGKLYGGETIAGEATSQPLLRRRQLSPSASDFSTDPAAIIGIHLRHQRKLFSFEEEIDSMGEECLLSLKASIGDEKPCVVLIASDRLHTLTRFIDFVPRVMRCKIRFVPRPQLDNISTASLDPTEQPSTKPSIPVVNSADTASSAGGLKTALPRSVTRLPPSNPLDSSHGEHGAWGESLLALAEWNLLSHAHFFIGTHDSTFSLLMANSVVARAARVGSVGNPILWMWPGRGCTVERPPRDERHDCENKSVVYDYNEQACVMA